MGTYLTKPVTTKESTHGECRIGERRVVYAATAVQGWRKTMEDAHSIVPHLEENTAFFAVYDGHGGSEVAEYCAKHLHELLQSSALYQSGDLGAALKEVFVECDHKVLEKEAIQEMKRYGCEGVQGEEVEESSSDEREEAAKLLEEAEMPLDTLLAQYLAGKEEEEEEGEEVERGDGEDTEGERQDMKANERVRFMLQELASQAGFEIEFEDTDDSEEGEEEQMDGEEEEKEEEEEEEEEGKEEEEEEKEEEEEGKGKEEEEEEEEEEGKEEKEEKEGEEEEKEEEGAREETNEGEEEKEKGKGVKEKEDEDEGEEDVKEEEREREVIGKRSAAVLEEVGGRGEGEAEELAITKRTSLKGATSIGKRRGAESPEQCVTKRAHVHSPEVTVNDTHFSVEQSREIKGHNLLEPSSDGDQKRRYGNQLKSTCRSLLEGKGHQNKRELEEGDVDPCSSSQTVSPNGCTEVCSVSTVHRSEGLAENGSTESIEKSRGRECHSSITRDAIAGTRAIAKNSSRSSKGHILVDLLTSTVDGYGHHVSQGSESEEEESEERLPLAAASPTVPVLSLSRKRHRHDEPEDLEMVMKEDSPKRLCRGRLDDEGYHSGTTAVVCLLRENTLTVANAGDSRCVLSCRGRAVDMSEDHKPTDPAELERINRAGGSVGADGRVNGGLNLSRAIGDHFYKENTSLPLDQQMITALPDIKTRELAEGDEFMVIACDGIWNTKSSQEVVDFIRSRLAERCSGEEPMGPALERICESLCDACLASDTDNDGTGCDNMTVTVALLQSPPSLLSSTNPAITQ